GDIFPGAIAAAVASCKRAARALLSSEVADLFPRFVVDAICWLAVLWLKLAGDEGVFSRGERSCAIAETRSCPCDGFLARGGVPTVALCAETPGSTGEPENPAEAFISRWLEGETGITLAGFCSGTSS